MDFSQFVTRLAESTKAEQSHDPETEETTLKMELEGGRHQDVVAYRFEEDGRAFVRFYTPIGRQGDVPRQILMTAMELNASLTHGAFALYEGRVVLTDTMELDGVDVHEGTRILKYLGRMADTFEKMAFGVDRT